MKYLIQFILVLFFLGAIGLIGYAYLGAMLGADFSAPTSIQRVPVTLDGQ
jgi:hypothetical protein